MDAIGTLKELRRLRLNGTNISARALEKLKNLTSLERLDLENCKRVGDDAVSVLASLPALRHVELSGTGISEKGLTELRRLKPSIQVFSTRGSLLD